MQSRRIRRFQAAAAQLEREKVGKVGEALPYFDEKVTPPNPLKDSRLGETGQVIITLSPNGIRSVL